MQNILINAVSAKIGGGKNILDNFILQLSQMELQYKYYILTPDYKNYKQYTKENLIIIDIADFYKKNVLFLLLYFVKFPILLRKYKIDLVFNFGDVLIPTRKKQIYFFDWPYMVYSAKYIWDRMTYKDYITRKIKLFVIKKNIYFPHRIIVQTKNIENKLKSQLLLQNIIIIPTPLSLDIINQTKEKEFLLPQNVKKYLYPANYMSHKNFEIIILLAEQIKAMQLTSVIVITVDKIIAKKFIKTIRDRNLDGIIINVGKVEGSCMSSLYNQCDAMLFPSLLETYGFPYIEAMACEKPILTSDLDFAHDICGDIAYYFNPFDVDSILIEMQKVFSNEKERMERIRKGKLKIQNLPYWETVVKQFQQEIDTVINS